MIFVEKLFHQFLRVVDFAYGSQCVGSVMGTDNQWLGFIIGNTTDAVISFHGLDILVKLCTERCIFYVVYGTVKTILAVHSHSASSGTQMRMIIYSEKQIKYAVFFCGHTKKATHFFYLYLSYILFFYGQSTHIFTPLDYNTCFLSTSQDRDINF